MLHCILVTSTDRSEIADMIGFLPDGYKVWIADDYHAMIGSSHQNGSFANLYKYLSGYSLKAYPTLRWAEIIMDDQGDRILRHTYKGVHQKNVKNLKVTMDDIKMLEAYFADETIGTVQWGKLAKAINANPKYVYQRMHWLLDNAAPSWRSQSKERTHDDFYRQLENWAYRKSN